jgi:hypothetical protein
MCKKLFIIAFFLCAGWLSYADTITEEKPARNTIALGLKLGGSVSLDQVTQNVGENKDRWGLNQSVGGSAVIYSDIFLNSFFAISPEFSMHFMRGLIGAVESDFVGEQIPTDFVAWSSNEFTTGVMIKLYYKWFYGGFGMGASYTTAPRFRSAIQLSGSGSDTADSVAMLNSQARKGS